MNRQQRIGCGVLVACCVLFLALGSFIAPMNSEICQKDEYSGKKICASHNVVFVGFWQTGKFLDEHSGGITAVATAFLAYITFLLVNLTKDQGQTTRAQMRAYLSITIGNGAYQDRQARVKFAGYPILKNSGQTPAYNVRYWCRADIIPDSLVPSYVFQVPVSNEVSQASIGPGEHRDLNAILPNFVADTEVEDIKNGTGKALWVWGTVHYNDAFGIPHYANFCQRLFWLPGDVMYGFYSPRFADSN